MIHGANTYGLPSDLQIAGKPKPPAVNSLDKR